MKQPADQQTTVGMSPHILVAGEALMDVAQSDVLPDAPRALPGGSPFNVAVGLARLGVPVGFLGTLSTDTFGDALLRHLEKNHVHIGYVGRHPGPTTQAMVTTSAGREPQYAFLDEGAADQQLTIDDLPETLPSSVRALHVGSYSLTRVPIGNALEQLMQRESGQRFISLDPNIRPQFIPDRAAYHHRLNSWIRQSMLVKLSMADVRFLFPSMSTLAVAEQWLRLGVELVVVTNGERGASAWTQDLCVEVTAPLVSVVDTVGAGDAFTSALLAWLHQSDRLAVGCLSHLTEEALLQALQFAHRVASMTCTRLGAEPPHL